MTSVQESICSDLVAAGFDEQKAAEETWDALFSAGIFVEGEFTFANGMRATLKAEAELLLEHPKQLNIVLGYFASYPCIRDADTLLYVARGMEEFTRILGLETNKPVAYTDNVPGKKYEFAFRSIADKVLARTAEKPSILEDIVTSLGSVAGTRRLLRPNQNVHSLAMLLRDTVDPKYQNGLVDHYLVKQKIPTDKDEFRHLFLR